MSESHEYLTVPEYFECNNPPEYKKTQCPNCLGEGECTECDDLEQGEDSYECPVCVGFGTVYNRVD